MIKAFTLIIVLLVFNSLAANVLAQANPSAGILPLNAGGVVSIGATMDLRVTINNTLAGTIPASKLRPIITVPALATILPDAQQTGIPAGWIIVSNAAGQIRVCNASDVVGGGEQRDIIIKVQGTSLGGPTPTSVQINFGGATCAVSGPAPNGNLTADDNASSSITVVAACNFSVSAAAGTIDCNGGTTSITAVPANATGVVEYSITGGVPFQASNVFTNVPAGSYRVTARETANPTACVAISSLLTITEPIAIPAPVVNIVQPTCTVSSGVLTITSGTTGLTFSIDGSSSYTNYNGGITLASGSHTIRAKNGNGCLSTITSFTINQQPATPTTPLLGMITQPDCAVSTGSVILNGLPTGNWIINPGAVSGNSSSISVNSLAAGTYNFTVTNDRGCVSPPAPVVVINQVPGAPAAPAITLTQPSCTVATGGLIITSPNNGLTFSLDGGVYQVYPTGGFTGLSSGNHNLIAKNAGGCLSPIANFTINAQPTAPPAPTVNIVQPSCSSPAGIIAVTSSTALLTFSFNNGPFAPYPVGGFTATPGTYNIAAQNSNGCAPSVTNNIIVNPQPASPTVTLSATPITCAGGTSILTVSATGAVLPYEYKLNNGPYQTSNAFNVSAGNYTVTVKDANGCTGASNNLNIVQPSLMAATISASAIYCNGGSSTLTVSASGGTGSLEYSLNNGPFQASNIFNVIAGTYSVIVRSISNPACSVTSASTTISQPALLKVTSTALPITHCGGSSTVKVVATGGTGPYAGTGNFDRGPGRWNFLVTDSKGCTTATEVIVMPPGCVELRISPNPAQRLISVNHSPALPEAAIQIYSMNGAMVLNKAVLQNVFSSTLDISALASGTYLMVFTNGKDRKEAKFVKTNK